MSQKVVPPPARARALFTLPGPPVVGGDGERPVVVDAVKVLQITAGGAGRLYRIPTFIDERIDLQSVTFACRGHELPQSDSTHRGGGRGRESRFDDRQGTQLDGQVGLDELFLDDGGRAAADVHGMEVIAEGLDVVHFLAKIHEVRARHMLLEEEAVEGAVGAQRLTERNVRVEQILGVPPAGAGGRSRMTGSQLR